MLLSPRRMTDSQAFRGRAAIKSLSCQATIKAQTQHSDQSTQGDFLVIHESIRQGSALHTLIRFPIQCAPGLALLGLSWGDVRRLMTADKRYDKHLRLTVPLTAQTEQLSVPPRVDSLWAGCIHQSSEELADSVLTLSGSHWFPVLTHRWGEESVQWMWRWGFLTWPSACRCDWEQISQIPIRRHLPEMMDRSLVSHQSSPAGERVTPVRNLSSYTTPLQPANHMEAL